MQVSIDKQIDRIIESVNALPEQVNQACVFALNRTAEWMKGRLVKEISAEHRIKLKLIRDRIIMQRADKRNPQSRLNCNFKSVLVRDLANVRQTPIGVVAGGKTYPHAFIATLKKGGKSGVYVRKTKKRFPLKSVTIPIFDGALKLIENLVGEEAGAVFEKRFLHEITRITGALA